MLTWTIGSLSMNGETGALGGICLDVSNSLTTGEVLNTSVTIGGDNESPNATANNGMAAALTIADTPDLFVSTHGLLSKVKLGEQFAFDLVYGNSGAIDATNVVLTEMLPPGMTLVSKDVPTGSMFSQSGRTLTWTFATVPTDVTGAIGVVARLTGPVTNSQRLEHTVTIAGTPTDLPAEQDNNSEQRTITVGFPRIYLPLVVN